MKSILLSILALLTVTVCNAQRVNLDRFHFKVTYRNLPKKPLGIEYKTFNVTPVVNPALANMISTDSVAKGLNIEGYQYSNENPDLTIKFYVDEFTIYGREEKEEAKKVLGVTINLCWYEVTYSAATRYELFDNKKGIIVESNALDTKGEKKTYSSVPVSRALYVAASLAKGTDPTNEFIADRLEDHFSKINGSFTENYGYKVVTDKELLWVLGEEKLPDFADYTKFSNAIKDAFAQTSPNDPLSPVVENLKPAIDYLNGIVPRFTADEKGDKKMRYSAYFNLGKIYLCLDMPDEAIKMGNAIIVNDYDTSDGKNLIKDAEKLKLAFELNKVTTRHLVR